MDALYDGPGCLVFDGHNDLLLRLLLQGGADPVAAFRDARGVGHIDAVRAQAGGFAGGLFAVFPPSEAMPDIQAAMQSASYDLPLPPPLALQPAQAATLAMTAILLRLGREAPDALAVCHDTWSIRAAMAARRIAAVLHIEGAEAIDPDFVLLDVLHAAGLRSLGPVWSRPNQWGHGVPFRFPGDPDTGPGLTEAGRALVRACNARRIMLDLSHLNEAGFWDVARITDAPLVASHSNVHALTPSARNLTARQLAAIRESGGLVGLNFATCFLRADGAMRADTELDTMLRHLDALLEALGEDGVAFGSDFDGAVVPAAIGSVAGLPVLLAAMRRHGFGEILVQKIAYENWLSLLARVWGEDQSAAPPMREFEASNAAV